MFWNYRPCKVVYRDGAHFEVKAVYYDNDLNVCSWSEDSACPIGDTIEELKADLQKMLKDVEGREVLTIYVTFCGTCGQRESSLQEGTSICSDCKDDAVK